MFGAEAYIKLSGTITGYLNQSAKINLFSSVELLQSISVHAWEFTLDEFRTVQAEFVFILFNQTEIKKFCNDCQIHDNPNHIGYILHFIA